MTARFVTKRGWRAFHPQEVLRMHPGKACFHFRAELDTRIYVAESEEFEDEILAAVGVGDLECEVSGFGPLHARFESEGRLWLRSEEIDQRVKPHYGTVFTEMMTRDRVSPEIRHMQMLMRQNELQRQQDMARWQRRLQDVEERAAAAERRAERASGGDRPTRGKKAGRSNPAEGGSESAASAKASGQQNAGGELDGAVPVSEGSD